MGLGIGQIASDLAARLPETARPAVRADRAGDGPAPGLSNREAPEPPRVGFGENTVSGPAAALETIGSSLREARRLVPSAEELREALRERRAEAEANGVPADAIEDRGPPERTRPEPGFEVRNFVETREALDAVAPAAEETPPPARPGAPDVARLDLLA